MSIALWIMRLWNICFLFRFSVVALLLLGERVEGSMTVL